jgi:hypothetical protein
MTSSTGGDLEPVVTTDYTTSLLLPGSARAARNGSAIAE